MYCKKETKADYEEAIEGVLNSLYPQDIKVVIDRKPYEDFIAKLQNEKLLIGEDKNITQAFLNELFDEKGLSFKELNNLRKNLNAYTKSIQNPTLKDYLKTAIQKDIRNTIDSAIGQIFASDKSKYAKAKDLYENALNEYGLMKDLLKTTKDLKLFDEAKSYEKVLDTLLSYVQGQGSAKLSNLERLTSSLSKENKAVVELNLLNGLFSKYIRKFDNIEVFDSQNFLDKLRAKQK
ncbi:hypothetical protein OQH60_07965 [Campylobacter sp. MIT 21-1685]|uniref:hypothetical protein n=1 Tax=unclassified Campylobacter TaxID=2593542 RepID=UPI00224ABFC9|nr:MULTISPECIES: hypothetical protein [unclassified Campylobacter]MCX2683800.1 hypothetical protein [Campylobacter sp. MIT 21-1684]MCX2752084.1 hypothetical protein [Campylobacter sp. MIT 21-1682]MCX2808273.1 hypothetical protein [Campylobacter sp. MIT 21-1685]